MGGTAGDKASLSEHRTSPRILGSVANLIAVQKARHQVQISFWDYFKVGAPLTVLTIGAGVILLG